MPYFRTKIRGMDRVLDPVTHKLQETPIQLMGRRIQVPGHARMHLFEPNTGRRIFPSVNATPDGPLKLIFTNGKCYIPDPETATKEELQAARLGNSDVAKKLLEFALDENNGEFGLTYEHDPNDADGYWEKTGVLVPHTTVTKTIAKKPKHRKMAAEVEQATKTELGSAASDAKSQAMGEVMKETIEKPVPKHGRPLGRPPGRPPVIRGAKSTADQ